MQGKRNNDNSNLGFVRGAWRKETITIEFFCGSAFPINIVRVICAVCVHVAEADFLARAKNEKNRPPEKMNGP